MRTPRPIAPLRFCVQPSKLWCTLTPAKSSLIPFGCHSLLLRTCQSQLAWCSLASRYAFAPLLPHPALHTRTGTMQTASQLFWQLANQVYNGSVNFANRNATVEVSDAEAATSLAAASAIACGMAFVMGKGAKRIAANPKYSPTVKSAVNRVRALLCKAAAPRASLAPPFAAGSIDCSCCCWCVQRIGNAVQGGTGWHRRVR